MKPLPLIAAALVLAGAIWRWRRLSKKQHALAAIAVVLLVVWGSGVVELPNFEKLIEDVGRTLGPWTYLLVGALAFLETGAFVGFIAPGEFTIVFGGVVAGQGEINVLALIVIVVVAAILGDTVSYVLGRRLGRGFLLRHGPRVKITSERLEKVEQFYADHGGKMILIGRFVGVLRALGPFIAGSSRMPFRRFLPADVAGAVVWGTTLVLLGYFFWRSLDQLSSIVSSGAFALGAVIVVIGASIFAYRYLRVEENRHKVRAFLDEQAEKPWLRPVVRAVRPVYQRVVAPLVRALRGPLAFLVRRFSPGRLGLELTALVALAIIGIAIATVVTVVVDHHHFAFGDRGVLKTAQDLKAGVPVDVARVLTWLGSTVVVGLIVAAVAVLCIRRRAITAAVALIAGALLTFSAVQVLKAAEDRPRPEDPLTGSEGSSFPSGHSAYSIGLIAAAIAIGRLTDRSGVRIALVVAAVAIAVVVGLTRVYLHVHYGSDVIAGWAIGIALFGLCASIAVAWPEMRDNTAGSDDE